MSKEKRIFVEIQDCEAALLEVATILKRLRETTAFWQDHFGAINRNAKKNWEDKADCWLKDHIKKDDE